MPSPDQSYDLSTPVGQIRALIPDRPVLPDGTLNPDGVLWTDAELTLFYTLEGDVQRAAALALERTAADQALLLKVMRTLDLQTDGAKLAAELRANARQLRDNAAATEDTTSAFDWAELVTDPFSARERLRDQWLRGAS